MFNQNITIDSGDGSGSISLDKFNEAIKYIGKLIDLKETFQKVYEDFGKVEQPPLITSNSAPWTSILITSNISLGNRWSNVVTGTLIFKISVSGKLLKLISL